MNSACAPLGPVANVVINRNKRRKSSLYFKNEGRYCTGIRYSLIICTIRSNVEVVHGVKEVPHLDKKVKKERESMNRAPYRSMVVSIPSSEHARTAAFTRSKLGNCPRLPAVKIEMVLRSGTLTISNIKAPRITPACMGNPHSVKTVSELQKGSEW